MGSYATTTSISELVPNFLSGNTTTSDTNGTAIFSRHIDRAESVVNAYVTARYSLPITPIPPILRTLTEDIASYYSVRSAYTQDGQNKNEYFPEYRKAMETLLALQKGDIKLSYTDGSLVSTANTGRILSSTEGYDQIFGLDEPREWKRDTTEIDDQKSARDNV